VSASRAIRARDLRRSFELLSEAAGLSSQAYRLRAEAFALRGYDTSMVDSARTWANSYDSERAALREIAETYDEHSR
jgi:hypothetical protein